MTPEQAAAFINAQVAMLLVELETMKATNVERAQQGHSLAYDGDAFQKLYERYEFMLGHNAVLTLSQDAARNA